MLDDCLPTCLPDRHWATPYFVKEIRRRAELNKLNNEKGWTKPPTPNQVEENNKDKTEAPSTKNSPKSKTNQIRLKLREPKIHMTKKKTKTPNRSIQYG